MWERERDNDSSLRSSPFGSFRPLRENGTPPVPLAGRECTPGEVCTAREPKGLALGRMLAALLRPTHTDSWISQRARLVTSYTPPVRRLKDVDGADPSGDSRR